MGEKSVVGNKLILIRVIGAWTVLSVVMWGVLRVGLCERLI